MVRFLHVCVVVFLACLLFVDVAGHMALLLLHLANRATLARFAAQSLSSIKDLELDRVTSFDHRFTACQRQGYQSSGRRKSTLNSTVVLIEFALVIRRTKNVVGEIDFHSPARSRCHGYST
jgi:hypothetical protein